MSTEPYQTRVLQQNKRPLRNWASQKQKPPRSFSALPYPNLFVYVVLKTEAD